MTNYHEVIINSDDRIYSGDTNTNFRVQLPTNVRFNKFRVQSAVIPFTYYIINDTNNSLTLTYEANDGNGSLTIPLKNGTYSSSEFVTMINGALSSLSPTFTFSFSEVTGKFALTGSGKVFTRFKFVSSALKDIVGFKNDEWINVSVPNNATPFVAELHYPAQLSGPDYLCIRSNYIGGCLVPKSYSTSAYNKQQNNIISKINVDANYGEVIVQERDLGVDNFFDTQQECFLNIVDFQLTYPNGDVVVLPENGRWSCRCAFYLDDAL